MATNIIDPNDVNAPASLVNLGFNAAPDYSDMFIFAELTAQRRTSSIITTGGVGKQTTLETENDAVKINMMGFDNATGQYTTKWTNNLDGTDAPPYEGFGITQIKITTNSSYVPVVDIEFVDIKGLSLISLGAKSPYSVIYSFPPPVFTLTVKGQYGKALSYNLHLVRQSTRFEASSGNFFINANFVAQRYAPLTDVLFKYIDIVPLMKEGITVAGTSNTGMDLEYNAPPKNTRELITRAKKLYDDLDQFKVDSKEASELNTIKSSFTDTQILLSVITNFRTFISSDLQSGFDKFIYNSVGSYSNEQGANMSSNDSMAFKKLNKLSEYDEVIKGFSPNERNVDKLDQRLCLFYEYNEQVNNSENNLNPTKLKQINDNVLNLRNNLLREAKKVNSKIPNDSIKTINQNELQPINGKKYIGLDITEYYVLIRQDLVKKQQEYVTKNTIFKTKINDLAKQTLGSVPTIRNIFNILANDIEIFFRDLRQVCKDAENEHKNHFDMIVNNNRTKNKFISAFPQILKNTTINDSNGGGSINRTERAYPGEEGLGFRNTYFPEIDFVENFITTFLNVIKSDQIANLKESVDDEGNNKWIPINPLDSVVNGRLSAESPYKNIFNVIAPIGSPSILDEIINRLYIISQYSYGFLFYTVDGAFIKDFFGAIGVDINTKNDKLVEFLAKAEATNLVNSIVDAPLLNSLQTQVTSWGQNINGFYDTLETSVKHYSDLSDQIDPTYGSVYININGQHITKNRLSDKYRGFELLYTPPVLRNKSDAGTATEADGEVNIIDKFIDEVGNSGFLRNLIFDSHGFDDFTKQNIAYIKDEANINDKYDSDFIGNESSLGITLKDFTILDRFVNVLKGNDKTVRAVLVDPNLSDSVKTTFILATLCGSLTYYHSENDINKKFAFPGVIEVPMFAHLYMGAYMYFYKFNTPAKQAEMDYFNKNYYNGFNPNSKYALYSHNISNNDADSLLEYFTNFVSGTTENGFTSIKDKIVALIDEVTSAVGANSDLTREEAYERRLEPDSGLDATTENDYSVILVKLMTKLYLLNYTQITFLPADYDQDASLPLNNFIPLKEVNRRSNRQKQISDNFFAIFFKEVSKLCEDKKAKLNELESKFRESIQDNDIKTQTYYSFKAIADKWVIGLDDTFAFGNQRPLIEEFLFVDRFFNDIGDKVVIDFRPLIELSQDYDVSIFTVLTKLLALNGFEFFPVQNFLNFQQDEWQNSFKTYGSSRELIKSQSPAFICMYIGGTSSQLNDPMSGYEDDGIVDEEALERSPDYKPDNVKGFKVHFSKQNQSMFKDIGLNTNEHKETNESLAILSEIAQDQSASSPVPKGQNLFSTYEQRSYNCKISGFGNVMIQPTQYFILENVPMFNGAYLILNTEHTVIANTMTTSFDGVRIRSNPNPIVTEFSTSAGVQSGDSDAITNGVVNEAGVSGNNGINRNNPNNTSRAGFENGGVFPVNPPITNDMTGRLISP